MSYDIIAFAVRCLLILAYYLYLGRRTRRIPDSCVHAHNAKVWEQFKSFPHSGLGMPLVTL